jgi:hypothetical protein
MKARLGKHRLQKGGREMDHRDRVTHQRQRRANALEGRVVDRHDQMTGIAPGDATQLWPMAREPVLQFARPGRGN